MSEQLTSEEASWLRAQMTSAMNGGTVEVAQTEDQRKAAEAAASEAADAAHESADDAEAAAKDGDVANANELAGAALEAAAAAAVAAEAAGTPAAAADADRAANAADDAIETVTADNPELSPEAEPAPAAPEETGEHGDRAPAESAEPEATPETKPAARKRDNPPRETHWWFKPRGRNRDE